MDIENICWHDGKIYETKFVADYDSKPCFIISAELYKEPDHTPSRDRYSITCENVKSFNFNCDVDELIDNESAGNISNGYMKDNVLRIYFCDGYLEVKANKFVIEKL